MRATGRQVKVARDYQLTEKDFHNVDLVMSLGGDGTFLKTASMINSNKLAIFGVNTDPSRSVGHLTSIPIPYEQRQKDIPRLIDFIEGENFRFNYKQRIRLQCTSQTTDAVKTAYALNEVFAAEKNVGHSSIYRLKADDIYMGKFKSSGVLIATGTGSTGWMQSAKRTSYGDVDGVLRHLGFSENEHTISAIADEMSQKTRFDENLPQCYYYVREPQSREGYENGCQGFAKKVEFLGELFDGMISVDGLVNMKLQFGDRFVCETDRAFGLKTIRFLL